MINSVKWHDVTKHHPCPICGKPDWCGYSGDVFRCMRVHDDISGFRIVKQDVEGGTTFTTCDVTKNNGKQTGTDWNAMQMQFSAALSDVKLQSLADELNVTAESLKKIGVGWYEAENCYTFPERDHAMNIIGIVRRYEDGSKKSFKGSKRGLTIPLGLDDMDGEIPIVEGPTDVAAFLTMGIPAIGRPSNSSASYLAKILNGKSFVIVGENDQKSDGKWPGRDGAITVANKLSQESGKSVKWVLPPVGVKDIRSFLGGHDVNDPEKMAIIGYDLQDELQTRAKTCQPPPREPGPDVNPISTPDWYTLGDIYDDDDIQNGLVPISSEFTLIDNALSGGFEPGSVYVLAARTGDGKTTLALNILRRAALQGTKCLLIKIEETPRDAVICIISATSDVPKNELRKGIRNLSADQKIKVNEAHELLCDIPLWISDRRYLDDVIRVCREFAKAGGQFVCIDQLNLIQDQTARSVYEKTTNVSNALRQLAIDQKLPILALCQINRTGAKAKSKDPLSMFDLRDSGHLENDASCVIFINSTEKTPPDRPSKMYITTGKNRNGPPVDVNHPITLDWWPETRRIEPGWVGEV